MSITTKLCAQVCSVLLVAALAAAQPPADPEADAAAIAALCQQWTRLYNAGAFEELVRLVYTDDAVLMNPNALVHQGREAIISSYEKARAADEEYCSSSIIDEIRLFGDMAVARGTDTGTTKSRLGGEEIPYSLKWLVVLERQKDGSWKWAYEMWNDNPRLEATLEDDGERPPN